MLDQREDLPSGMDGPRGSNDVTGVVSLHFLICLSSVLVSFSD